MVTGPHSAHDDGLDGKGYSGKSRKVVSLLGKYGLGESPKGPLTKLIKHNIYKADHYLHTDPKHDRCYPRNFDNHQERTRREDCV